MIQEADVGVGIVGREGLQAARASDFSIGRFHFLKRLLLVHGRYSYHRSALVANYSFYKSLFICFMQITFQFMVGFSGTSLFNSLCLMSYNVAFTGLPVMGYVLDKDLPEEILTDNPFLYKDSQSGRSFNYYVFFLWFLRAVYQSIVVFVFTVNAFWWLQSDYASLSLLPFTVAIILQSLTIIVESHYVTMINHVLVWGTLFAYFVMTLIANSVLNLDMYGAMTKLYASGMFWLATVFLTIIALAPVISFKYFSFNYCPSASQLISYFCHLSLNWSIPVPPTQTHSDQKRMTKFFDNSEAQWVVQMVKFEEEVNICSPADSADVKTPLLKNQGAVQ